MKPPSTPVPHEAPAIVVMGVSGAGKSEVARGIAAQVGGVYLDADDLHSAEAVAKMRSGTPLTDEDRWPWLDRVGAALAEHRARGNAVSVACSALKLAYRDRLRAACPGVRFVFLEGDAALIEARMRERSSHYMPAALLQSQLRTLERPAAAEADVTALDIAPPLAQVIAAALAALQGAREP